MSIKGDINLSDYEGFSFFLVVCEKGNDDIVYSLFSKGVVINFCMKCGLSFFFLVCVYGYVNFV